MSIVAGMRGERPQHKVVMYFPSTLLAMPIIYSYAYNTLASTCISVKSSEAMRSTLVPLVSSPFTLYTSFSLNLRGNITHSLTQHTHTCTHTYTYIHEEELTNIHTIITVNVACLHGYVFLTCSSCPSEPPRATNTLIVYPRSNINHHGQYILD